MLDAGTLAHIALITLLWGANWPAMKVAVTVFEPWVFRLVSVFGAGIILLALAATRRHGWKLRADRIMPLTVLSLFSVTGWHLLTAYGLLHIGGGKASIVAFTMPAWAALFASLLLKERLIGRHVLGIALGMAGLAVLMGHDLAVVGSAPIGTLLILGAAICWALATVGIKMIDWKLDTIALAGWQLIVGGIPILVAWYVFILPTTVPDFSNVDAQGLFALFYTTVVALVFCFTSYVSLVRRLPAYVAAVSTFAMPLVGVGSAALLLGEPVGIAELVALVLVLCALALVLLAPTASGARAG